MRRLGWVVVWSVAGCLVACGGGRKIDGSSAAALKESVERLKRELPADQVEEFEKALVAEVFRGGLQDGGRGNMWQRLDGLSVEDVLLRHRERQRGDEARQTEQMREEIEDLMRRAGLAEAARATLAAFTVTAPRLLREEGPFGRSEMVISLVVRNGCPEAVSRAYFTCRLATPGRAVPWLEEEFNYQIPGGLEPGEMAKWRLTPSWFAGGWSNAPDDLRGTVFSVKVEKLDGPDGEPIADATDFGEVELDRLAELQRLVQARPN